MRLSALVTFGLTASFACVAALGISAFVGACDSDEHRRSTPSEGGAVGACVAQPGAFPAPNCDPSDNKCTPTPGCAIDNVKCGAGTCLPMTSNSGPVLDFRFRRLNMIAPPALTFGVNPVLQTSIINSKVDLKAKQCGELGTGSFSWLLRIDTTKNTLTTGGAPPSNDPFGAGYCFYNHEVAIGDTKIEVQPVTVNLVKGSEPNAYSSEVIDKLSVPIFLDATGSSVIVLPLSKVVLKDVTISDSGNCIGSLNTDALDKDCTDVFSQCSKWKTAGSLGGYITLEEADRVFIQELRQSLCVVVTQQAPNKTCPREGNQIIAKGDYCSKTGKPGDCQDSYWLAATFAAAAVKINDGSTTPSCQGGSVVGDAGADSGSSDAGSDSSADAPTDAPADGADAADAADAN